jgi:hypothetical protein
VAGARHVARARRHVARRAHDLLGLDEIARMLVRARQPEAGVHRKPRHHPSLRLRPDASLSPHRLTNAPVRAQRHAERERRRQIRLEAAPPYRALARLGRAQQRLPVALHHRHLVVEAKRIGVGPPPPRVQPTHAAGSGREGARRGHHLVREPATFGRPLLEEQEDRGLVHALL